MTRFERKNRSDIEYIKSGDIIDFFNNEIKNLWFINDDEYDFLLEVLNDEELNLIITNLKTFQLKRKCITLINEKLNNRNKKI